MDGLEPPPNIQAVPDRLCGGGRRRLYHQHDRLGRLQGNVTVVIPSGGAADSFHRRPYHGAPAAHHWLEEVDGCRAGAQQRGEFGDVVQAETGPTELSPHQSWSWSW